jgi:toxin ParE1/3/4
MARLILWSPRALDDVDAIAAYISQDSEAYAASVVRLILSKARTLADFPHIGRIVPEFDDERIREIFAYSYRIIYEVTESDVTIATVIHGSRLL